MYSARGAQQSGVQQRTRRQEAKRRRGAVAFGFHVRHYKAAICVMASRTAWGGGEARRQSRAPMRFDSRQRISNAS